MNKCLNCGKEIENPKFCNHSCSATYTNKKRKKKIYGKCKRFGCENSVSYRSKYCSNKCHSLDKSQKIIDEWISNQNSLKRFPTKGGIRDWFLDYKGRICSECGIGESYNKKKLTLEIDHIDGDYRNNYIDNLRVLCPNCHSQTETYRSKNRNSKRDRTKYKNRKSY